VATRIDVFAVDHEFTVSYAAPVEYGQRKQVLATKSKADTNWTPERDSCHNNANHKTGDL
jgi:hypothetical protein